MSDEEFGFVEKSTFDLTLAKANVELVQKVDVLLKILDQERAFGYREGHMNAIYQRKWVKLTDEEINALDYSGTRIEFVRAIEFALEKKNTPTV